MEFPLRSLAAFGASFGAASLLCTWFQVYVLGWYEPKWTPGVNVVLNTTASLILFLPAAMVGFALGAYSVNSPRDPWGRSMVGGALLALLFYFGVATLTRHFDSVVLNNVLAWGALVLGGGILGGWARYSARNAAA